MTVVVITPPEPVVTFEEAKQHVRIDDDGEKAYVEGLIAAAQGWIDGPAGWLGRAVGPQLLELTVDACPGVLSLPYAPVLEVTEAWTGAVELPVDQYVPGAAAITFGMLLPRGTPVRVQYWAGYGKRNDAGDWVPLAPAPIKVAIMMLVAQWYMARAAVNVGNIVNEMPFAVDALLQPYRVYR